MRSSRERFVAWSLTTAALLAGGGSLLLLGWFLYAGPILGWRPPWSDAQRLLWDALLSTIFFVQHSAMLRGPADRWLARRVAPHYRGAVYTIASGIALALGPLFWQTTDRSLGSLEGAWRFVPGAVAAVAVALFAWAAHSIPGFDAFGTLEIRRWVRKRPPRADELSVRGPYRHVRHPFYALGIVIIWSTPDLTLDRLLMNVLWTVWIVAGARWEERDLTKRFGEAYRAYRSSVPMLVPWRLLAHPRTARAAAVPPVK